MDDDGAASALEGAVELLGGDTEDDNMFPDSMPTSWRDIIESEAQEKGTTVEFECEFADVDIEPPLDNTPIAGKPHSNYYGIDR